MGDHEAFGDRFNTKGPAEVRLAHAEKKNKKWEIRLVKESPKITANNIPSKKEFASLRQKLIKDKKNCVFFVHGFNQSFERNLEKSLQMQEEHDVEVIIFSWPSNPGGFITEEYKAAKKCAALSVGAFDSTLEKLGGYLQEPFNKEALKKCGIKISLMAYSLGNFLLQNYVQNTVFEEGIRIFSNVILCQADVDNDNHAEWVDKIKSRKRVYVTINENDYVLKWSDINLQKDRLGNTARNLNASNAVYFDFTDGKDVDRTHGVFYKETHDAVRSLFSAVLNGERVHRPENLIFDSHLNAYRFPSS